MDAPAPIAVFARAPVEGEVKTRLIPLLGAQGATRLHARLIESTLSRACAVAGARVTLWVAGNPDHPVIGELAARHGCAVKQQQGADLGERMHATFVATLEKEDCGCVLIGTDCPALDAGRLSEAAAALATHDVVLGPALDGGYVLIALRRPQPALFDGIAWSGPTVLATTRRRIARARLRCHELTPLPDLDTPDDYRQAVAAGLL